MEAPVFKELGTIELGSLKAKLVQDPQGRKCIAIPLHGDQTTLFTVTHALLVREILGLGLRALAKHEVADDHHPA